MQINVIDLFAVEMTNLVIGKDTLRPGKRAPIFFSYLQ